MLLLLLLHHLLLPLHLHLLLLLGCHHLLLLPGLRMAHVQLLLLLLLIDHRLLLLSTLLVHHLVLLLLLHTLWVHHLLRMVLMRPGLRVHHLLLRVHLAVLLLETGCHWEPLADHDTTGAVGLTARLLHIGWPDKPLLLHHLTLLHSLHIKCNKNPLLIEIYFFKHKIVS